MGISPSERGARRSTAPTSVDFRPILPHSGLNDRLEELPFGIPFIERGMPKYTYDPGQRIFGLGDPCDSLVVLTAGKAKLVRPTIEGKGITITILQAPAVFAEGVLPRYPWDAWAVTPAVVRKIDMDVLPEVFREAPHFRRLVLGDLADYVSNLANLVELLLSPGHLRVFRRLHTRWVKQEAGSYVIENVPKRQQLAEETGLTRESVHAALNTLEKEGVIERMGKKWKSGIKIRSLDKLRCYGIDVIDGEDKS